MQQNHKICKAYVNLGGDSSFYDGMITCTTLPGKAVCRLVWAMGKKQNDAYLQSALDALPKSFAGRLLEVPVGTGILSMPLYHTLQDANIECVDYSPDMMARAKARAEAMQLENVHFAQGDVGNLLYDAQSFDAVLSLNGFHAFPDKEGAYREVHRVLKPNGLFFGCFYVRGKHRRTDWLVKHIYVPKGYFTPPFETEDSLRLRLEQHFDNVKVECYQSIAVFSGNKRG